MIDNKKDLYKFLEKEFPHSTKEEWDFVGLSINNKNNELNKILLTLDVNALSVEQAIKNKVNLIISFHPFCFANSWNEIYKYDFSKKDLVHKLKKEKIDVYSIHTNFDLYKDGTKFWLCRELGWDKKIIETFDYYSLININLSFNKLIDHLKDKLKINNVLSNWNQSLNKKINNVVFWPGAGNVYDILKNIKKQNIDLIITSDIKWNEQQVLNSENINFLIIPHKIEDIFVKAMKTILTKKINKKIKIIKYICKDFIKAY